MPERTRTMVVALARLATHTMPTKLVKTNARCRRVAIGPRCYDARTFMTMNVRSSYCSASRIQFFISADSRALISSAWR